jgi:hypothetical protein
MEIDGGKIQFIYPFHGSQEKITVDTGMPEISNSDCDLILKKRHDCMTLTHKFMMSQWSIQIYQGIDLKF